MVIKLAKRGQCRVDQRDVAPPGNKTWINKPNIATQLADIDAGLRKVVVVLLAGRCRLDSRLKSFQPL